MKEEKIMKKIFKQALTWNSFLVVCIGVSIGLHVVQYNINKAVANNITGKSELIHDIVTLDSLQTVKIQEIVNKINRSSSK